MQRPRWEAKDWQFLAAVVSIILIDQITKFFASAIPVNAAIPLLGETLEFSHLQNTGALFGMLQDQNVFLGIATALILLAIGLHYSRFPKHWLVPVGLLCGGALGNLIDRMRFGYVIDFISFSFWPAFNIADAAITIGALWVVWVMWKERNRG